MNAGLRQHCTTRAVHVPSKSLVSLNPHLLRSCSCDGQVAGCACIVVQGVTGAGDAAHQGHICLKCKAASPHGTFEACSTCGERSGPASVSRIGQSSCGSSVYQHGGLAYWCMLKLIVAFVRTN